MILRENGLPCLGICRLYAWVLVVRAVVVFISRLC